MPYEHPSKEDDLSISSWWGRPAGGREVLRVALPLVVTTLSWTLMTFCDRMFLKWESGLAMSAAFSASMVWFAMICLPLGICAYSSTFVAQYHGDQQPKQIGPAVWQGVWLALLAMPLLFAVAPLGPWIFELAQHGAETIRLETVYFQILCLGGPGLLISAALASFYNGRGETAVVMRVEALFALLNLVLDYWWIFGGIGFPAMGIAGAGWATVVSLWLKAMTLALLVLRRGNRLQFGTWSGMRFDRRLFRRLVYFGGPNGVQIFLEFSAFTLFVLLVSRLGALEAEATSMVFSISTLAFMPIWGFGQAASILVGQRLGENRDDLAARATWTSLWIAMGYMAFISALFLAVPGLFLYGFFVGAQTSAADEEALRHMGVNLLRFVVAYNLFDTVMNVFVNAIKGAGDTRFVSWVSLVMGVLLAGLSWIGVELLGLGVYGCWAIITAWIWGMGIIYWLRFRQGKWRQMRVIESQTGNKEEADLESTSEFSIG